MNVVDINKHNYSARTSENTHILKIKKESELLHWQFFHRRDLNAGTWWEHDEISLD